MVLGPVALLILKVAPPGTCGQCLSPVRGWSSQCRGCGGDVRVDVTWDTIATPALDSPPVAAPEPAAVPEEASSPPLAATGIFVEGSEPLRRSAKYRLTVRDEQLHIARASAAANEDSIPVRGVRDLDVVAEGDRLVITGATTELAAYRLVFRSLQLAEAQPESAAAEAVAAGPAGPATPDPVAEEPAPVAVQQPFERPVTPPPPEQSSWIGERIGPLPAAAILAVAVTAFVVRAVIVLLVPTG
jgi:hypothetical protein